MDESNSTQDSTRSVPRQQRQHVHREVPLTISQQSKVAKGLAKESTKRHRPSRLTAVFKWTSSILIGGLFLACLTLSKISVISLAEKLGAKTDAELTVSSRAFVMLLLLLLIPNMINLFRATWISGFRKDMPWPKKRVLIKGFFVAFMETLGLCLFTFKLLYLKNGSVVVLLMNCVFLFNSLYNLYKCYRDGENSRIKYFVASVIFELVGFALTCVIIYDDKEMNASTIWHLAVSLICLSVVWLPSVQKSLLKSDGSIVQENLPEDPYLLSESIQMTMTGTSVSTSVGVSTGSSTGYNSGTSRASNGGLGSIPEVIPLDNSYQRDADRRNDPKETKPEEKPKTTWKLVIYMSALKILFTWVFSIVLFAADREDSRLSAQFKDMDDFFSKFRSGWDWSSTPRREIYYFAANGIASLIGYCLGFMACATCMQKLGFAVPLFLATPLAIVLTAVKNTCSNLLEGGSTYCSTTELYLLMPAVACLVIAQILTTGWLVFRSETIVMQKETELFWIPTYNGILLEQWMLNSKRNVHTDEDYEDPREKAKRTKVFICTTMYREADYEMKQLLESINRINLAQSESQGRHFESHVFFDGGVKDKDLSEFALQLVALVEEALGVRPEKCSKTITPYGMSLSWDLNSEKGKKRMVFRIHFKDNFKVKNKKRWSQIMYMSYVLDFQMKQMDKANEDETYILTTDADVRFTPESVEALLDLMTRDPRVGAVCARTHPLGNGPLVWYQTFEYAIGHWFQKAAEHVLGSVLCAPGCFSVYRCSALKDIVPTYASQVEHAFDFLIKDMGEDRWLCTLMVQSGWRIEYCAASENSTYCPENFDEFYKQRRRWVASTIANLMLLIKESSLITKFNHRISVLFLIYQAALLVSTLIGPSTIILVISGGLDYAWDVSSIASVIIQFIVCVMFALICVYASSDTQLNVAKFLTFLYAVIMTAVAVGVAQQIAEDLKPKEAITPAENGSTVAPSTLSPNAIAENFPISTTTLYLAILAGMFITTGLLHPQEFLCLLNGIWYLLCLPSGYLILNIYSICNITDRSWGTREAQDNSYVSKKTSWRESAKNIWKSIFFCWDTQPEVAMTSVGVQCDAPPSNHGSFSRSVSRMSGMSASESIYIPGSGDRRTSMPFGGGDDQTDSTLMEADEDDEDMLDDAILGETSVRDWLPVELKDKYAHMFEQNGFEKILFISGMNERDLREIGVKKKGHLQFLTAQIKLLPDFEIQAEVPEKLEDWLEIVGLLKYKKNFHDNQIKIAKDMEVLKGFTRKDIETQLEIRKAGHIKRLMYAIGKLRNPTEYERKILDVKKSLEMAPMHKLQSVNAEESDFWDTLKKACLLPGSKAFGLEEELKLKLGGLRNSWLMILGVANTLWLILITTLASKADLTVIGANVLGLAFLFIFGIIFIIQFLSMLVHRISTMAHYIARAPYRYGEAYNTSWAFNDEDMRGKIRDWDDREAFRAVREARRKAEERIKRAKKPKKDTESQRLLDPQSTTSLV